MGLEPLKQLLHASSGPHMCLDVPHAAPQHPACHDAAQIVPAVTEWLQESLPYGRCRFVYTRSHPI